MSCIFIWEAMIDRCSNSHHPFFSSYGGCGIKVCREWSGKDGFWRFVEDMGERPEGTDGKGKSLWSIDRIDNDKGYGPDNCRWATASMQQLNRQGSSKREDPFPGYSKSLLASLEVANVKSMSVRYP
jgi:hypothetical protein